MNRIKSVISSYFEGAVLPPAPDEKNPAVSIEDLSSMCIEAMYIIDFQKQNFHHISCHNLFLCGHSCEEVMQSGFDFYAETVHKKDFVLLTEIFRAILTCLKEHGKIRKDASYFSFTVRLKAPCSPVNKTNYLMVYHKLKPVFIDEILYFGVCMLSCSVMPKSGNLRVYFKNSLDYSEYSFDNEQWENRQDVRLTEQEIQILQFSKQRMCNKKIADILDISYNALRLIKMQIYRKLGVETIEQAIIYATNHRMLFNTLEKSEKDSFNSQFYAKKKRQRNRLTGEKLYCIQTALDNGQSVNSIAKETGISEGAIRKAVSNGKLTKNRRIKS